MHDRFQGSHGTANAAAVAAFERAVAAVAAPRKSLFSALTCSFRRCSAAPSVSPAATTWRSTTS
jgi:hypothetical protein